MNDRLDTARKLGGGLSVSGGFLAPFAPYAMILFLLGLGLVFAAYVFKMGKRSHRTWFGAFGVIFVLLAAGVWFLPEGGGNGGDDDDTGSEGGFVLTVPQTEQGGGRDAATEMFNDGGSDFSGDCTADTGGGTETLAAEGTNLFFTRQTASASVQITMDDDASTGVAGFSAPDCVGNDFMAQPKSPLDVNQDGNADNQLLWARVVDMGRVMVSDGNLTATPALYYTAAEGPYVAWMTEDADQTGVGTFITACPDAIGNTEFSSTDCNTWRFLGDTTGAAIYVAFVWAWDSSTPPWYYTNGYVGESFNVVIEFGHGSAGSVSVDYTFTYNVQLIVRT